VNNSELIKDLQSKGLSQETFYEAMSWDEFVKEQARLVEDDKALKALLILKKEEERVAEVSLEQVLTSSFQTAKDTIDKMTLAKRIEMLDDLDKYRDYLYEQVNRYGAQGLSKDEQLKASEFRVIMGRIKHMEIIQNWLFGII
jgi:hypothetical protein